LDRQNDHLGTPRMIADQTGSMANVKRHDYLPFGEEIGLIGGRTGLKSFMNDGTQQKFTGYERDWETGLDYAKARYDASAQGRFLSVDPLLASADVASPQSLNRYS
jgi:RHS repeat-associated protein